jgi:hypothetical protein
MHLTSTLATVLAFSVSLVSAAPTPEAHSIVSAVFDAPAKDVTLERRRRRDNCGNRCQNRIATAKSNMENACAGEGTDTDECVSAKEGYFDRMNIENPTCNKTCQAELRNDLANAKKNCDNQYRNPRRLKRCFKAKRKFLDGKLLLSGFTQIEMPGDSEMRYTAACEGQSKDTGRPARASRTPDCNWARDEFNHISWLSSIEGRLFSMFTLRDIKNNVKAELVALGTYEDDLFYDWSGKFADYYHEVRKLLSGKPNGDLAKVDAAGIEEVAAYEALGITSTLIRRSMTRSFSTSRADYLQVSGELINKLR